MMARCYREASKDYKNYGARGIRVHKPWHDVRQFVADIEADIGPRPEGRYASGWSRYTLDRIDNDLGYFPGNIVGDPAAAGAQPAPAARQRYHGGKRKAGAMTASDHLGEQFGGPFYHGTTADLKPGGRISPEYQNPETAKDGPGSQGAVFFSMNEREAHDYAGTRPWSKGDTRPPRVYTVQPTGAYEPDPASGGMRSRSPLTVTGEIAWKPPREGHFLGEVWRPSAPRAEHDRHAAGRELKPAADGSE